jgi:hypothetical protein
MYILLGDSNLRQTYEDYKDELAGTLEEELVFEQTTTNEALKIALEKEREEKPKLFYISTILNEIAAKCGKGKPIDKAIKAVTEEQNRIVNKTANVQNNSSTLYLLGNPYLRQDPKWM